MPVVSAEACTKDAVWKAIQNEGSVSYETDNNEQLAVELGFDWKQANLVFGHIRRLKQEGKLIYSRLVSEPYRLHYKGSQPAPVRTVTYTVIE